MTRNPTRRRVLQLGGAGATASLAGCGQFSLGGDSDRDELRADEEPEIDPADGIAAAIQPPEDELDEIQQEVIAEAQEEGYDQMEAQAEIVERQQELVLEYAIDLEADLLEDDEVSVEAAIGEQGLFLLDAPEEQLVDLLRDGEVDALLAGEEYANALEAQQEAPPEEGMQQDPDEDDEEEDADEEEEVDEDSDEGAEETDD